VVIFKRIQVDGEVVGYFFFKESLWLMEKDKKNN